MITDFCAVLLYLPTRDEWIEIINNYPEEFPEMYLPTRDEWIEININKLSYVLGIVSPFVGWVD